MCYDHDIHNTKHIVFQAFIPKIILDKVRSSCTDYGSNRIWAEASESQKDQGYFNAAAMSTKRVKGHPNIPDLFTTVSFYVLHGYYVSFGRNARLKKEISSLKHFFFVTLNVALLRTSLVWLPATIWPLNLFFRSKSPNRNR